MKGNLYTENEKKFKTLTIGKTKYKIIICDKIEFNNKNHIGFIDYERSLIFINNKLKKRNFKETLIHEITHALIYETYKNKYIGNKKIIKRLRSYEPFIECLGFLIEQNFNLK